MYRIRGTGENNKYLSVAWVIIILLLMIRLFILMGYFLFFYLQITEQATKDYNRGRMYLSDYATREGVPVFQNIAAALQHAIQLVQSSC